MSERLSKGMRKHIRQEAARVRREKSNPDISRKQLIPYIANQGTEKTSTLFQKKILFCPVAERTCPVVQNLNRETDFCPQCPDYISYMQDVRFEQELSGGI